MSRLRIEEAYQYARENGYAVKKKELAEKLFPGSNAAKINLTNLFSGKTRRIDADLVETLCKEFGVSADYLFGLTDEPVRVSASNDVEALLDLAALSLWKVKSQIVKK